MTRSGQKQANHGKSNTVLYSVWSSMIARCHRPKGRYYNDYGGRGIGVCEEWRQSFETFELHVSQLPHFGESGRTLDRINNEAGYEPGNVRWATGVEQHRNTRGNRLITFDGRTQCIMAWANEIGITYQSLSGRLKRGWSLETALTVGLHGRGRGGPKKTNGGANGDTGGGDHRGQNTNGNGGE